MLSLVSYSYYLICLFRPSVSNFHFVFDRFHPKQLKVSGSFTYKPDTNPDICPNLLKLCTYN
jgi:hypothetical protein